MPLGFAQQSGETIKLKTLKISGDVRFYYFCQKPGNEGSSLWGRFAEVWELPAQGSQCPTEHSVPFLDQWDGQRRPRGVWEWEEEFITKPHLYSSPTSLSSSLQCQREKILSSRVLETCLTRRELTQDTPLSCLPTLLGKHELLYTFISLLFIGGRSLPIMEMKVLCGKQTQSIV